MHSMRPLTQPGFPSLTRLLTWSSYHYMTRINIYEAKTHFSRYAERVKAGETLILCDRNRPFAEWRPLSGEPQVRTRALGWLHGQCPVGEEFFAADPEVERLFFPPEPDSPPAAP